MDTSQSPEKEMYFQVQLSRIGCRLSPAVLTTWMTVELKHAKQFDGDSDGLNDAGSKVEKWRTCGAF